MAWMGDAEIGGQLLVYVLERGRGTHARRHRETQPVRLAWPVIGVLAKDHRLYRIERRKREGVEDLVPWRIDAPSLGLPPAQKIAKTFHVRRGELALKPGPPAGLHPDVVRRIALGRGGARCPGH